MLDRSDRDRPYTSDRRLYLDADGKVVEEDDPTRVTLLVGVGGSIPAARARELGLVDDNEGRDDQAAETVGKMVKGPAEHKMVGGPMPAKLTDKPVEKPAEPVQGSQPNAPPAKPVETKK